MAQIGALVYDIVLRTEKFTSGTKVTKREFNELKRHALEAGRPVDRLQEDFAKLTRVGRELGDSLAITAKRFGQVAASQKGAGSVTRRYIANLKNELQILKERVGFGDVLSHKESARMAQLSRQIPAYERSIAVERRAAAEKLRASRASAQAAALTAQREARAADWNRRVAESIKNAEASQRRWNATRRDGIKLLERSLSPRAKLIDQMRKLRDAHRSGLIATRDYNRAQRNLNDRLQAMRRPAAQQVDFLEGYKKQLAGLIRNIGVITLAYRAWMFAQKSVTTAMMLGREEMSFEIFTGSADIAKRLVSELQNLAATTPLVLSSTMQATRTLLQYGVASDVVVERLKQLGDVSGGSHERLQRLALAMGQITANGRLQGQELRQLIESGFNPLSSISKRTGQSMLELRDQMADGAISAEMVEEALKDATSEGGRFNGQMQRIANETSFGKIQVMLGQLEIAAVDVAEEWADAFGGIAEMLSKGLAIYNKDKSQFDEAMDFAKGRKNQEWILRLGTAWDSVRERTIQEILGRKRLLEEHRKRKKAIEEEAEAEKRASQQQIDNADELIQKYRTMIKEKSTSEAQRDMEEQRQIFGLAPGEKGTAEQEAILARTQALMDELQAIEDKEEAKKEAEKRQKQADADARRRAKEFIREQKADDKRRADAKKAIVERAKAQKEELINHLKIKKALVEVRELERRGLLNADEARRRREQLKEEFEEKVLADKKKEAKDADKSKQIKSFASGTKEEYKFLANRQKALQDQADEKLFKKKTEMHWTRIETAMTAIGDKLDLTAIPE